MNVSSFIVQQRYAKKVSLEDAAEGFLGRNSREDVEPLFFLSLSLSSFSTDLHSQAFIMQLFYNGLTILLKKKIK